MKPLEAELALMYCERARASIARVAEMVQSELGTQAIMLATDYVLKLQREIEREAKRERVR